MFADRPAAGVTTLATLGLSTAVLSMGGNREVRQELLLAFADADGTEELAKLLLSVAEGMLDRGRALARGEVIGNHPSTPVGTVPPELYASMPVVYPQGLTTLADSNPATVFVWLVPLRVPETEFIRAKGWNAFEDLLQDADPDLFDLRRVSIV